MLDAFVKLPLWLRLLCLFPLLFLNGWLLVQLASFLEPLVSIVTIAGLLAFLLNFPVRFLESKGLSRGLAFALVGSIALLVAIAAIALLVPLIVGQLSELIANLPQFIESGSQQLDNLQTWAIAQKIPVNLEDSATQLVTKLTGILQSLGNQVLNVVGVTIGTLIRVAFVLILTIFLVLTGEQVWRGIFSWIPAPWDDDLRLSIRQTFSAYFASQAILAGILSAAQTLAFTILQVPYGVLFGVTIGLATLVPYTSAFITLLVSGLLMLQDFWLGVKVLVTAIVIGQINDNIVAPRLIGNMTGLNPVWIIVALFVGGKLAGILGLLVAVPCASVLKVSVDLLRERVEKSAIAEASDRAADPALLS